MLGSEGDLSTKPFQSESTVVTSVMLCRNPRLKPRRRPAAKINAPIRHLPPYGSKKAADVWERVEAHDIARLEAFHFSSSATNGQSCDHRLGGHCRQGSRPCGMGLSLGRNGSPHRDYVW